MAETSVSLAQHYHQRTKYDPATIHQNQASLNWDEQPVPYKDYRLGTTIDLKPYLEAGTGNDLLWWQRLSRLLVDSYGLTAKVLSDGHAPLYLRAAPSAGGLYPAEVYLIARGTSQLPAGLYNYQVRSHSLLRFWDDHPWQALQQACFWHPALANTQIALVVTVVFQRSAWRYQARAYRRIFLDSGHLLGNLDLVSSLCDYRPHLIGGFIDEALNQLLYLDPQQEGAIAVLALADLLQVEQNLSKTRTTLPTAATTTFPELSDEALLPYLHQLSQIPKTQDLSSLQQQLPSETGPALGAADDKYNLPFCTKISTQITSIPWGESLEGLEKSILQRRSTRRYTGSDITLAHLSQILDFAYQPAHYFDQGLDAHPDYFDLSLIETFVVASGVKALEAGCYYYASQANELRQIRFKQFRSELHYLCLGQTLGRDASAVIFHTADLSKAIERYGDRAYRYLHMDAGHLGQRLNLAATHLQLGVSGIAGFFDDQVNEVLGIPDDQAVLYITTLGQPWRNRR